MLPTRQPCDRLTTPSHFGRRPDVHLVPGDSYADLAADAAALIQHRAALTVLDELTGRKHTLTWLAGQLDETPDQLRRKLYGQANASNRDIARWGLVLGLETTEPFTNLLAPVVAHA